MKGNWQEKSTPILKRVLNSFEIANVALNKHFYRTEECPALAELTSPSDLPWKFSDPWISFLTKSVNRRLLSGTMWNCFSFPIEVHLHLRVCQQLVCKKVSSRWRTLSVERVEPRHWGGKQGKAEIERWKSFLSILHEGTCRLCIEKLIADCHTRASSIVKKRVIDCQCEW